MLLGSVEGSVAIGIVGHQPIHVAQRVGPSYRNKQLSWCFGVVDLMEFTIEAPLSEIIWISLNHRAAIRKMTNLGQRALKPRAFPLEIQTLLTVSYIRYDI